jgi:cytochrome b6-f complex iron-sulfur subunit
MQRPAAMMGRAEDHRMHQEAKPGISRRSFLDRLLAVGAIAWLGSVIFPIVEYFKTPPPGEAEVNSVVAANIKNLKPNSGVVFKFGREPAILIMAPDGSLHALSAVCTHLQCTVQYRPDLERIWCACHNGMYDLNGRNISGPPPRPLTEYKVAVKGDDVIVSRA